tara:strand:+ start:2171 stop:2344 length:174 start_codon:yes stop_codon:yes gene_type:complete
MLNITSSLLIGLTELILYLLEFCTLSIGAVPLELAWPKLLALTKSKKQIAERVLIIN